MYATWYSDPLQPLPQIFIPWTTHRLSRWADHQHWRISPTLDTSFFEELPGGFCWECFFFSVTYIYRYMYHIWYRWLSKDNHLESMEIPTYKLSISDKFYWDLTFGGKKPWNIIPMIHFRVFSVGKRTPFAPSPSHHHFYIICGINFPFPVMGGLLLYCFTMFYPHEPRNISR